MGGETPLDVFFSIWDSRVKTFLNESLSPCLSPLEIGNMFIYNETKVKVLCDFASLLLQTSNHHNNKSSTANWLALHSAIKSQSCPWSICRLFIRLYPEQSHKYDSEYLLPVTMIPNMSKEIFYEKSKVFCFNCGEYLRTRQEIFCSKCFHICEEVSSNRCSHEEEYERLNTLFVFFLENPSICKVTTMNKRDSDYISLNRKKRRLAK